MYETKNTPQKKEGGGGGEIHPIFPRIFSNTTLLYLRKVRINSAG